MPATAPSPLTRNEINGSFTVRRFAKVDLGPDLGAFRIRSLTSAEMRHLRTWVSQNEETLGKAYQALIVWCVVGPLCDDPQWLPSEVHTGALDNWDSRIETRLGLAIDEFIGWSASAFSVERIKETVGN